MSWLFAPLDDWSTVVLRGQRARDFLHGQCSQDIKGMALGAWALAAALDLKGRVVANFVVCVDAHDEIILLLPGSVVEPLRALWQKVLPFFRLEFLVKPDPVYAVWGEGVSAPLALHGQWGLARALPEEGQGGDVGTWHCLRVLSGWHFVNAQTSGAHTVHALGLEVLGFFNFEKGCYLGQEIVARMHYRGKVKQRIYPFRLSKSLENTTGRDVCDGEGQSVGRVIEHCTGAALALLPVARHREQAWLCGQEVMLCTDVNVHA